MANLSVKDVPEELAERLRQRAARNHRSLQGELMAIIEQAANETEARSVATPAAPAARGPDAGWNARRVVRRGSKSIEQIAAEHRDRFPQPIASGPSAVDIIRADRDAR
ncbi:Arc family DNA-binding protein [Variovorax sp. J2P1-59]|uniref:FitA-like ribbon-helix-helix domain-containing protein n=1 Tax=Variovorax flavidus TaxID=3053501 RepID=UPI0025773BA5|nr:Arc family DNA-binding protein [Variovorax sp. J2P1-59]MDM0077627.1 Arc family DNA-binding protein [Variovorax sp. J2P1-59]